MKKVKDKAVAQEKEAVSYYYLHKFDKRYDEYKCQHQNVHF